MKKNFFYLIFLSIFFVLITACIHKKTMTVSNPHVNYLKTNSLRSIYQIEITQNDGFRFRCTMFLFDKFDGGYYMATAGHCIVEETGLEKEIKKYPREIKMVFRERGKEKLYPVDLIATIYNKNKEDFSIAKVKIDKNIPLLKFSDGPPFVGQCVYVVGFPEKYPSENIFFGYIEDDSDKDGEIAFKVRGMDDSGGISGSPLFSCLTKEVIGVVVSHRDFDNNKLFAIPIPKFKKFARKTLK